jgi:AcrR family transcriptional regulator
MSSRKARQTGRKTRVRGDRTRDRILDTAERLFAKHGYDGVSLRTLATAAEAQLGLVHYHFGDKLDVYKAMWARWFPADLHLPFEARLELSTDAPIESNIRSFVDHFFGPLISVFQDRRGRHLLSIVGREISDPKEASRGLVKKYLDPRARLLVDDIHTLMPSLTKGEVSLAYNMMTGIASSIFVPHARIVRLSPGPIKVEEMIKSLPTVIEFVVGGWMGIFESRSARLRDVGSFPRSIDVRVGSGAGV